MAYVFNEARALGNEAVRILVSSNSVLLVLALLVFHPWAAQVPLVGRTNQNALSLNTQSQSLSILSACSCQILASAIDLSTNFTYLTTVRNVIVYNATNPVAQIAFPVSLSQVAYGGTLFDAHNGIIYASTSGLSFGTQEGSLLAIKGTRIIGELSIYIFNMTVDSSNGLLFVSGMNDTSGASYGKFLVAILNGTKVVESVDLGKTTPPRQMLFDPENGYVYTNTIVLDGARIIGNLTVQPTFGPLEPDRLFYNPKDGYVYGTRGDNIFIYNGTTLLNAVSGPGYYPTTTMLYDSFYGYYYEYCCSGEVNVLNGSTVIKTIGVPNLGAWVADSSNGLVYVWGPTFLMILNGTAIVTVETNVSGMSHAIFNPLNNIVYAWQSEASIVEVNGTQIITPVVNPPLSNGISNVFLDPFDGKVYVLSLAPSASKSTSTLLYTFENGSLSAVPLSGTQVLINQLDSNVQAYSSHLIFLNPYNGNIFVGLSADLGVGCRESCDYAYVLGRNTAAAPIPEFPVMYLYLVLLVPLALIGWTIKKTERSILGLNPIR
jgi:hypothetical protein